MRAPFLAFAAAASLATAWHSSALACRYEVPVNLQAYENVALVKLESAEPIPTSRLHLWRMSATVTQVITGASPGPVTFLDAVNQGAEGCPTITPAPGDPWVVYSGDGLPQREYPLFRVQKYDLRLESLRR